MDEYEEDKEEKVLRKDKMKIEAQKSNPQSRKTHHEVQTLHKTLIIFLFE